jgi:hypothetical protein
MFMNLAFVVLTAVFSSAHLNAEEGVKDKKVSLTSLEEKSTSLAVPESGKARESTLEEVIDLMSKASKGVISEFELTELEKTEIDKLLYSIKTSGTFELNKVLDAAYDGNPVAMYIAGQCCLLGLGTVINRDSANIYFKMSASLGYAPALFEIFQIYKSSHPFLALVYLNLAVSYGHREYKDCYLLHTELLSKIASTSVVREMEMIALKKSLKISEKIAEVEKLKGTVKPGIKAMTGICSDDFIYEKDEYWKKFFDSQEAWERFFGIVCR